MGETIQVGKKMFYKNLYFGKHQETQSIEKLHGHFKSEKSLMCTTDVKVNQTSQRAKSYHINRCCTKSFICKLALPPSRGLTDIGENFNVCNELNENMYQKSELTKDQSLHTGENGYECNKLREAFDEQSSLQRHESAPQSLCP